MNKEDLIGKFHTHFTVPENQLDRAVTILNRYKVRHKTTVIDLSNRSIDGASSLRDVMITTHYHTFRYGNFANIEKEVIETYKALMNNGVHVYRMKIEHEDLPTLSPTVHTYRECHIKIGFRKDNFKSDLDLLKMDGNLADFSFSNNPHSSDKDFIFQFMNIRSRSGTIDRFDSQIELTLRYLAEKYPDLVIFKPKIETTIVDTHRGHDSWWA